MLALLLPTVLSAPPANDAAPAVPLSDVNPTSPTYGEQVSVKDVVGERSAWYFGHAN